jgi:MFS transporter, DHA2 family, multidrug resistance protein
VLAVAAAVAGHLLLPESKDPPEGRSDLRGQLFAALTLAATTFALIDGQEAGFGAPRVVAAWALAAVAAVLFVRGERRQEEPVIDMSLLRDRRVAAGLLAAATSSFALFAVLLLVSLDLQVVGDYSGLQTAGMFAPMTLAMVAAGPLGGRLVARMGPLPPLVGGLSLSAVACAWVDLVLVRPVPVVPTIAALTVMGAGFGLVVAPMVGTVLARVPARRSGMGAAAVTAAREVGGVMGVATLGAIVNGMLFANLTHRLVDHGIPLSYRQVVIDAVRRGTALPTDTTPPDAPFIERYIAEIRQNVIDRTVDAGKAAYVDSVRTALLVAVGVLLAGAIGVALLLRHASPDTPETVG